MFVLLKTTGQMNETMADSFQRLDYLRLPNLCRITKFDIQNNSNELNSNCCKDLFIFTDTCTDTNVSIEVPNEVTNAVNSNDKSTKNNDFFNINDNEFLYECKISVKGFRDQLNNGKSIWI